MIVILDHTPYAEEVTGLVTSGCTELLFPYVDEAAVALYAARLEASRAVLVEAGVQFGVSGRVVGW